METQKNSEHEERRGQLLIVPEFQKSFLMYTVGIAVGINLFYFVAMAIFFKNLTQQSSALGLPADHVFLQFLQEQQMTLNILIVGMTIMISVGLFLYGLYMSNRIAGPIHHLKVYLRQYRTGTTKQQIHFRKNDYFMDLAEEINETLDIKKKKTGM